MIATTCRYAVPMFCLFLCAGGSVIAADGDAVTLLDLSQDQVTLKPSSEQVTHTKEPTGQGLGLAVRIDAGEAGYPGLAIIPKDGPWDLSAFGHVEAKVINTGPKPIHLSLRVDNAGDWKLNPWNTEARMIQPGETGTIKVIFGYAYGFKPNYQLNAGKVTQVLLFTGKAKEPASFNVLSLVAGGEAGEKPPVNPDSIRIVPKDGVVIGSGVDASKDLATTVAGGKAEVADGKVVFSFDKGAAQQAGALRPAAGRWNLRDYLEVKVSVTNVGDAAVTPQAWLESGKGNSDVIAASAPLAPGESAAITVPFASSKLWQGPEDASKKGEKGTGGSQLASNIVAAVKVAPKEKGQAATLRVDSAIAAMPAAVDLPDWLGKRPPVEGDWKLTFEENFDSTIDPGVWNIYTANYWDKRSHFSKDNVIVEDGVVKLRFEHKTGHHNDDPEGKVTDYATGFLDTYGKWVQRYGYFEARMKLPTAPGLWPAFWLMPDRGIDAGPQWKRADIGNGGMEFDIMEYLSRWGPNRFSPAFHWDGYKENHKSTGSTIYFQPDKDGFVTVGLLWTPGSAKIYTHGQLTAQWDNPRISSVESYIIFTAVSGGWDNDPLDHKLLPDDFVIDYVRVWQRSDLASEVDGPQPPEAKPAQ